MPTKIINLSGGRTVDEKVLIDQELIGSRMQRLWYLEQEEKLEILDFIKLSNPHLENNISKHKENLILANGCTHISTSLFHLFKDEIFYVDKNIILHTFKRFIKMYNLKTTTNKDEATIEYKVIPHNPSRDTNMNPIGKKIKIILYDFYYNSDVFIDEPCKIPEDVMNNHTVIFY